jgi:hypothetical protein
MGVKKNVSWPLIFQFIIDYLQEYIVKFIVQAVCSSLNVDFWNSNFCQKAKK